MHLNMAPMRTMRFSLAILPGESEEEFQRLYSSLVGDLQPKGTLEEEIVSSIAMLHFHRRRICEMLYDELYVADLPP